jgi:formylglycine-generating enzyme required for sulfatase activity
MKKRKFLFSLMLVCLLALGNKPSIHAQSENPAAGMIFVDWGGFLMGSEYSSYDNSLEKPLHMVTLSPFYINKFEVTQKEWFDVMGTTLQQQRDISNKSSDLCGEGDDFPMYYVNWYEAIEYCNKLSLKEELTPAYTINERDVKWDRKANGYRLPTEAEWEYAAGGGRILSGNRRERYRYSGSNTVDDVAWYSSNSNSTTHEVGKKSPNTLGIYDMSGNVSEWCWDLYENYSSESQIDPQGASSGSYRVFRGGNWNNEAYNLSNTYRYRTSPYERNNNIGFRVVR